MQADRDLCFAAALNHYLVKLPSLEELKKVLEDGANDRSRGLERRAIELCERASSSSPGTLTSIVARQLFSQSSGVIPISGSP